ncbi:MAG TPA: hypothetical protein VF768_00855 [Holophagaceae bacterium]
MASIQAVSSPAYVPPVKAQAPQQAQPNRQAEETREPAREAQSEARNRTEEPGQSSSQVGTRINMTA